MNMLENFQNHILDTPADTLERNYGSSWHVKMHH